MKKLLTWTFISFIAVLAMCFVALDVLSKSTARERDAAIARVRIRAGEQLTRSPMLLTAEVRATEARPVPPDDCEEQERQWRELENRIGALAKNFDREARDRNGELRNGARAVISYQFDAAEFSEGFWPTLMEYADSRAEHEEAVRTLLGAFSPECDFLQKMRTPGYIRFVYMLDIGMAAAMRRGDHEIVMDNMTARVPLAYMAQGFQFPYKFEPEDAVSIANALKSGVVREETWRRFLRAMLAYRDRDFMIHYVHNYPHVPFGATVQETSYLKRGVRALIREVQEPALNKDAARFAPVLEELAALSAKPFYIAKPELDRLVNEYDLTPHERHSYLNESAARASIVNLVQVVFPRNAVVQAQIDLFSIAIAIELTRIRLGRYPTLLEGAVESLGGAIPLNPVDGTPYRYETTDTGFRLGVEFAEFVLLPVLNRKSDALWVEMVSGELRIMNGV